MANNLETTIFKEATFEEAVSYAEDDHVSYAEDAFEGLSEEEIFGAGMASVGDEGNSEAETVAEFFEPLIEGEDSLGDLDDSITEFVEKHGDEPLPGAPEVFLQDFEDDAKDKETDYVNDGDLSKFMDYIGDQYPANIPQHDGRSMVGCEKAITFLDKLNSQISGAIREDGDNALDVQSLESVRVNIMKDILVLKNHLGKLKKKFKEEHTKESSLDSGGIPKWTNSSGKEVDYKELKKEAGTPNNIVIAVSPFERAISGIMINAHVSGGHSMEDVYGFLAKKYSIDDREELAIMQLCMDSGFHIFKDRGTYSPNNADSKDADGKAGVDFMRNYFA
jgi:hypothetical protein